MDLSNTKPQQPSDLIPKGTIARVHMRIKPGGFDDPMREWGAATQPAILLQALFI